MLLPPDVRIRTTADLTRVWRVLRGDLRFGDLALWLLVIDADGSPGPLLSLAGLPDGPYDLAAADVQTLVEDILGAVPGRSAAVLYGRPGTGPWHLGDRAWTRFLGRLPGPLRAWPVHRARDDRLEIVLDTAAVVTNS